MSYPTYTRIPFSAYPQDPVADSYNAGNAEYGSQSGTRNAYEAGQRRLAAQKAWEAQQKAAGQNTYSNRVELEKELADNENEIRKLQVELESMQNRWKDLDSMDRELAANRARIGDMANARAHQTDIINRRNDRNRAYETRMQWRWQEKQNRLSRDADQKKQAQADIRRIIGEIEDIDAQIPYHTEIGAQNALRTKRNRLVSELAAYGVSSPVENQVGTPVQTQGSGSVAALVQIEAAATNNKGHFYSSDERDKIAKAYEDLGLMEEAKRVRNTKTTQEDKDMNDRLTAEKDEARRLVSKYQNMTESQRFDFSSRWNRNYPGDREIKLLRKYATFNGSAPVMK